MALVSLEKKHECVLSSKEEEIYDYPRKRESSQVKTLSVKTKTSRNTSSLCALSWQSSTLQNQKATNTLFRVLKRLSEAKLSYVKKIQGRNGHVRGQ